MSANIGESYNEQILQATIDGEPYVNENPYPSRIEILLMELKESIEQGGGGVIDTTVNGTSENAVQNKAIYNYVNSSVATNTANFIGTFNSVDALEAYSGTVTNNDYAFVVGTDSDGNTVYNRYKYNSDTETWAFEYALNNSSFTAAQWAAINSGLTSSDKTTINGLGAASTKGFDATPTSGHTDYAVSSDGVYQALVPITAELVELVDSGAKNLIDVNIANPDPFTDIHLSKNSDGSITITATNVASTRIIILYSALNDVLTVSESYVVSGCDGGNYDSTYGFALSTSSFSGQVFEDSGSTQFIYNSAIVNFALVVRAGQNWTKTFRPMICPKSAWDISQKYVPYCPSMAEMYAMIQALQ